MVRTYKGVSIPDELAKLGEMSLDIDLLGENCDPILLQLLGKETMQTWKSLAEKWIEMAQKP